MLTCKSCSTLTAGTYRMVEGDWYCNHCAPANGEACRLFEFGHENPIDPKGSTAHVRDIKARRWNPSEKRMFYYEAPKTYFIPKG